MSDDQKRGNPQADRLLGEGAPRWLILGFALVGVITAIAAAWVFLSEQPASPLQLRPEIAPYPPAVSADKEPAARQTTAVVEPAPPEPEPQRPVQPAEPGAPPPPAAEPCPQLVTILFKRSSARPIITDLGAVFGPLQEWFAKHPEARLSVEGHADSTGRERSNLILSYRRSKAVVGLLRKAGIPKEQLAILAAGEHQPIAGLPDSAAPNRRVVLQIEGSGSCRARPSDGEP